MIVKVSDGTTVKIGTAKTGNAKSTWEFTDEERFIGFSGQLLSNRLSKMGVLIYKPDCAQGEYLKWVDENQKSSEEGGGVDGEVTGDGKEGGQSGTEKTKEELIEEEIKKVEETVEKESNLLIMLIIIIGGAVVLLVVVVVVVCMCKKSSKMNKIASVQPAQTSRTPDGTELNNVTNVNQESHGVGQVTEDDFNSKHVVMTESNMKLVTDTHKETIDEV